MPILILFPIGVPEKMSHMEIRVVGVAGGSVTHAQTTGCSFESQATSWYFIFHICVDRLYLIFVLIDY